MVKRFLILLLVAVALMYSSCILDLNENSSADCENELLDVYADSLDRLIVASRATLIHQISDSLLVEYGDLNCRSVIRIKAAKATAFELQYNFKPALEIYNELLKIIVANNYLNEEVNIRINMARIYETIDRPEFCVEQLNWAKDIIDEHELYHHLSRYYVRNASYLRIHKPDERTVAKDHAAKAVRLGEEYGVIRSVIDGNLILGLLTDDFEESVQYLERAANNFYQIENYWLWIAQQINIAKLYTRHGDYKKAKEIIQRIEPYLDRLLDNEKAYFQENLKLAKLKAIIFDQTVQKDSLILALKNINKYSQLHGDITNQEIINQLEIKNAIEHEREKVLVAKKQARLSYIGLILLFLISMILLRLYVLNRKKSNKIEEQKLTITEQYDDVQKLYNYQSTLLSEVHHRIKNNLQLIISLLTLQKAKLENEFENNFINVLSQRITSIALIHEQLYSLKEFEKINVNLYAQELLRNLKVLTHRKNVLMECQLDDIKLNLETITPLGLIWAELISNSLKYNEETNDLKIHLELRQSEDEYKMHYHDNGVGYPEGLFQDNKVGIGFTIIQSLTRQLAAKTSAYNSGGAHFTMKFKEKMISPLKN